LRVYQLLIRYRDTVDTGEAVHQILHPHDRLHNPAGDADHQVQNPLLHGQTLRLRQYQVRQRWFLQTKKPEIH